MYLYRKNIAIFGIALPVLGAAVIIGACAMLKAKMKSSFENKQSNFRTYEQGRIAGLEIEAKVTRQVPHLERWEAQLSEETASAVGTNLREIYSHLPGKEIQQTAFERPGGPGGFGNVCAQKSSQIRIAMRGTFRTLQRAFLELESRMPQLQLEEIRIDPASNHSSLLNFQVTYTAWEN